jgi:hypothetical protein
MFNKNGLHLEEIAMKIEDRFKTEDLSTQSALARVAACVPKAKAEKPLSNVRLRLLILGVAMAVIAAAPARSTILFKPVGRPPEVFAYNGETMSQPLASKDTNALNSPKVYFIFVGPNWTKDNTKIMIDAAKAIFDSSYLSGLTQYGSDGRAVYGDDRIDGKVDPTDPTTDDSSHKLMWKEIGKTLNDANFSSWLPTGGDDRNSPIYIVVKYKNNGDGVSGGYGGWNHWGTNEYTPLAVNAISIGIDSVAQVDGFTWALSHELVERMFSGTGGFAEVSPSTGAGKQIGDGEPEGRGSDNYQWRLKGTNGPLVTSYWSFVDQAFIVPDGNLDRTLLVPVWDNDNTTGNDRFTGKYISLEQGNLYELTASDKRTRIDTKVQSFTVNVSDGAAQIFDLTADGQVKKYNSSDSDTPWTPVTGSDTVASTLVSTSHLVETDPAGDDAYSLKDGKLYMLAAKDGSPKVWEYSGSGTNWTAVTGSNTTVKSVAAANGGLYMIANNHVVGDQVWQYSGAGTDWNAVTGSNTSVASIASAGGALYMNALTSSHDHDVYQVWRYNSSDATWAPVTDTNIQIYSIAAAGDVLCMLSRNFVSGGAIRVWQYGLTSDNWFPLTGTNTQAYQILVQDGSELFMAAANDSGPVQMWQYSTPYDWTALTGPNTIVQSASVSADNRLYMVASNDGGHRYDNWIYNGTPDSWSVVK